MEGKDEELLGAYVVVKKGDVQAWIEEMDEIIQIFGKDPEIKKTTERAKREFEKLLSKPFVSDNAFYKVVETYGFPVRTLVEGKKLKAALMRKTPTLRLAMHTNIIEHSGKNREAGEADLIRERKAAKNEEAFLFVKVVDVRGMMHTKWFEIGEEEGALQVTINPWKIGAILKRVEGEGVILEASVYHYHPNTAPHRNGLSIDDLVAAAGIQAVLSKTTRAKVDFRVIDTDGAYVFSDVTASKVSKWNRSDVWKFLQTSGFERAKFLEKMGIAARFEARTEKLFVR